MPNNEQDAGDVTKVITVRLPRRMRDALRRRAMKESVERGESLSLNTLCVEKLAELLGPQPEHGGQGDGQEKVRDTAESPGG